MAPQYPYPPAPPASYIVFVPEWTPSPMRGKQPQVTDTTTVTDIQISTTSVILAPLAEQTGYPSPTPTPPRGNGGKYGKDNHHGVSAGVVAAAGVIATIIFILVLLGLCVFLCRRSRKTRERASAQGATNSAQQMMSMKAGDGSNVVDVRAYAMPTIQTPTPSHQPGSASSLSPLSSSSSSLPSRQFAPQVPPVILSTSMGHSYFTGIDTSDQISLADNRSASNTIDPDDAPPPYRPRSVPPLSRECSVRMANGMVPNYRPGAAISPMEESIRNPFDDPEGDVSDLEDDLPRHRNQIAIPDDHLSAVSDLSYQQEPTTTCSSI